VIYKGTWYPVMAIESYPDRKEVIFYDLPPQLEPRQVFDLARAWARRELPRRNVGYEVRVLRDSTVEVWCTLDEVVGGELGKPLMLWDDPAFKRHLSESFAKEVNEALGTRLRA